jgi:hypothetical protein
VAAKRNDRGIHGAGLPFLFESLGGAGHNAAGLVEGLGLFLRGCQPDGFQREQLNAVELANFRVKVMRQGKVDGDQRLG